MSDLQIKINQGDLNIDIEGNYEAVTKILDNLRENGLGKLSKGPTIKTETQNTKAIPKTVDAKPVQTTMPLQTVQQQLRRGRPKKKSSSTPQLVRELDLSGIPGKATSLNEFMSTKSPSSNVQITTLFVYYLEQILDIHDITIDHIFTCYKHMGLYIPKNLQQNLTDASGSKFGYINRRNSKYSMTIIGINVVERQLS